MRMMEGKGRGLLVGPRVILFVAMGMVAMPLAAWSAQAPAAPETQYTEFESRPAQQMDSGDAAIVKSRRPEIVNEAAFWGYNLDAGAWNYDQVICPEIPDRIVLHYRRAGAKGEFLFTAVVPRGAGRVLVVPVLYGGATPFESAIGGKRTMAVFNETVPAEVAQRDVGPDGHWLELGMTYAVIAGAEPRVPEHPEQEPGLTQAPESSLKLDQSGGGREIVFSDRQAKRKYTVWTIDLNGKGRAMDAAIRVISDFEPAAQSVEQAPGTKAEKRAAKVKKTQEPEEPKVKVIPEPPEPPSKPQS